MWTSSPGTAVAWKRLQKRGPHLAPEDWASLLGACKETLGLLTLSRDNGLWGPRGTREKEGRKGRVGMCPGCQEGPRGSLFWGEGSGRIALASPNSRNCWGVLRVQAEGSGGQARAVPLSVEIRA